MSPSQQRRVINLVSSKSAESFSNNDLDSAATLLSAANQLIADMSENFLAKAIKKHRDEVYGIKTPIGTFGARRIDMPQIRNKDDLVKYLKDEYDIDSTEFTAIAKSLRMTQIEYNPEKVMKNVKKASDPTWTVGCIISSDNYVLDGTHRFLGAFNHDPDRIVDGLRIDAPMVELLPIVQDWDGAEFVSVDD